MISSTTSWHTALSEIPALDRTHRLVHDDTVSAVDVHPGGAVFTGTCSGLVYRWSGAEPARTLLHDTTLPPGAETVQSRIAAGERVAAAARKEPAAHYYLDGRCRKRPRASAIERIRVAPTGQFVYAQTGSTDLLFFDGETGAVTSRWACGVQMGERSTLMDATFTPDGQHLISLDDHSGVKMWRCEDQRVVWQSGPESYAMAMRADGDTVAIQSGNEVVLVRPGTPNLRRLSFDGSVSALAFVGDTLSAASRRGQVVLENVNSGARTSILPPSDWRGRWPDLVEFAAHGPLLAIRYFGEADGDLGVVVWNVVTGQPVGAVSLLDGEQSDWGNVAFDATGETLAVSTGSAVELFSVTA